MQDALKVTWKNGGRAKSHLLSQILKKTSILLPWSGLTSPPGFLNPCLPTGSFVSFSRSREVIFSVGFESCQALLVLELSLSFTEKAQEIL